MIRLHMLPDLQALVLDEVDVLLGDAGAFDEQVGPLVDTAPESARLVLVTATLPEPVFIKLQQRFPGMTAAMGPNLHKIAVGAAPWPPAKQLGRMMPSL